MMYGDDDDDDDDDDDEDDYVDEQYSQPRRTGFR